MKILLFFISLIFYSSYSYAELKFEKVGSWDLQLDGTTFGMTSNSSYSTYFPGGEITLKNGANLANKWEYNSYCWRVGFFHFFVLT